MHPGVRAIGAALPAVLLMACGGDPGRPPNGAQLGSFCTAASDCTSLFCLPDVTPQYCSARCLGDAECAGTYGLVCGVRADGSKACLNPCSFLDPGFTCKDGVPTACELVGPESCADCGCATGSHCRAGVGCVPLAQVGEACTADADCASSNCSQFAGVCRVGVGQPCLADNCDTCHYDATGWSFCGRECDGIITCNGAGQCLRDFSIGASTCRPPCIDATDPRCPGTCRYEPSTSTHDGYYYCDCPDCQSITPKRELGQICRYASDCASGACQAPDWQACTVSSASACGTCTKSCAADADCGSGLVCAMICATAQAGACAGLCLPRCATNQACAGGNCRVVTAALGASVMACDGRRDIGGICESNLDCLAAHCILGTCSPPEGLDNGAACGVPSDCKSGSCVNAFCKGASPIGGACTAIIDCASGTCCSNVCKTAC